ncbi:hypothetical protein NMS_1106 [Nonlabens marinus S1-08]|uniref:Uncharacterized protein n=1 Tax=Nonlabens marinus S1-08 TaxID=1454201 RepID=W8VQJ2_9FLAO|nr:hypothetical protein NMS_1106 [Nonlabens marinus S1-08]
MNYSAFAKAKNRSKHPYVNRYQFMTNLSSARVNGMFIHSSFAT